MENNNERCDDCVTEMLHNYFTPKKIISLFCGLILMFAGILTTTIHMSMKATRIIDNMATKEDVAKVRKEQNRINNFLESKGFLPPNWKMTFNANIPHYTQLDDKIPKPQKHQKRIANQEYSLQPKNFESRILE